MGAAEVEETMTKILSLVLIVWLTGADVQAKNTPDARQAACEATIAIICTDTGARGSGVVIATKDQITYALTARHVIAKSKKIKIMAMVLGKPMEFDETPSEDEFGKSADLALVRFSSGDCKIMAATLGNREKHLEDFPIFKTSWKDGDRPVYREDRAIKRVLVKDSERPDQPRINAFFWQTKGTSEKGESGGGMFNEDGKLLGICSGNQMNNQSDIGYFVNRDEIYFALKRFAKNPGGAPLKSLPWLNDSGN